MNTTAFIAALSFAGLAGTAHGRVIVENFDGLDFNPELNFDFSSDFTGGGDTSDHIDGVLWLYSDLTTITVNSLEPGEWIASVQVTWTDFCGTGCTVLELFGASNNLILDNSVVSVTEVVLGTVVDLGEPITYFNISSFEGRIEEIVVNVVPAPSMMGMLGVGGLIFARRRRSF